MAKMKTILIAAWAIAMVSVILAGALCWRFLGVHESGLVEIGAMVMAIMIMVAGFVLASSITGIALALRQKAT